MTGRAGVAPVYRGGIADETTVPERYLAGITRCHPDDREDLAAFRLARFGPESRQADQARHQWLFDRNPGNDDEGPGIWLARRDDAIVGQLASIPFELRIGHDERRAAWAVDLAVEDAWQERGVPVGLMATLAEARAIVAAVGPSQQGYEAFRSAGATDLGVVPVYLRPLDVRRTAELTEVGGLVRRLAPFLGPIWRFGDLSSALTRWLRRARLVKVERFDERAIDVWSAAADYYPVLARRDRTALSWRLDQRPDRDRLQRFYLTVRRRVVGYVVLRLAPWRDHTAAVVVDYLAPPRWVAPLLLAAGRVARRHGAAAMLVTTRNEPADRSLRRAGFLRRDQINGPPVRFLVRCRDEAGICALVQAPECWLVTSADGDLEQAVAPADSTKRSTPS